MESFPLKIKNKTRKPAFSTKISQIRPNKPEKEKKNLNCKLEIKLFPYEDDMILYIENFKQSSRKTTRADK